MWALQVSFHTHKLTLLTFQPTMWVDVVLTSPLQGLGVKADVYVEPIPVYSIRIVSKSLFLIYFNISECLCLIAFGVTFVITF